MKRALCCLALATAVTACHRPDDYLLSPALADQVLSVTLSSTTLPADGISRATITAQLDPRTDFDKRNVTFATTAGTLIADGKEGATITVTADAAGKAVTELRSSTTAATARIDVSVATVVRTASVDFVQLTREQVFDVSVSSTSVPADGFTTSTITVILKRLGTIEQRAIKFETSAGTFIASGQTASNAVTMTAGAGGAAVVQLQSDTPGVANVRVTALDTVYELAVTFVALTREDAFDVSVDHTAIPADGFSTAVITVVLKRSGTAQQRTIKFEASAGTLIAPGQPSGRTLTLAADAAGSAVVELQSDKTVGSARVRVTAFDLPYEFSVAFTGTNPADVIIVSAEPAAGPADGVTAIVVTAKVAAELPAGRRLVAFRTSLGQITPAAIEADGSNMARASVTSTTAGYARITATVDGVTAETSAPVQFTTSLPDRVFVAPDAAQLKLGDSTTIRVTLVRAVGNVSPRLAVSYSATTGTFSRVTLAENGVSTAMFNIGTTGIVGQIVTITVSVEGGPTGTATIQIVP